MAKIEYENFNQFEKIKGFLVRPSEEDPTPMLFEGVLLSFNKGENNWYVVEALYDHKSAFYSNQDDEEICPVKKGDILGMSHTGALTGLETKLGHAFVIEYTGKKIPLKAGRSMWECKIKVSKNPVKNVRGMANDTPF